MSIEYFVMFFSVVFIATITPGPNMLLALNHGVSYGIRKSVSSCIGNLIANMLMALVSVAGLGAIIVNSGSVFNLIKWFGAAYLIYLGIKIWLDPVSENNEIESNEKPKNFEKKSLTGMFVDGFVVAAGNPKGIIFFTALLPQFIDIKTIDLFQFTILFTTMAVIAFGCFMLYAICGSKLTLLFNKLAFKKIFNKVTGGIFIGTGILAAFSKR